MTGMLKISAEAVALTGEMLFGCERCSPDADTPFDGVLRALLGRNGEVLAYELSTPARCPSCDAPVSGGTLVEPALARVA